ncbi:hypothetical protein AALB_4208 [Agarivorans albus MKT 106]|uniref:Uncharacterized protein n=1 Tax=Agarivorans albus MKT 106 TaxID=1331007 RepID=R9PS69_AGAAL|nr:hypothetical protein AALB_4208 [Agarivorans albus MKT 106]
MVRRLRGILTITFCSSISRILGRQYQIKGTLNIPNKLNIKLALRTLGSITFPCLRGLTSRACC